MNVDKRAYSAKNMNFIFLISYMLFTLFVWLGTVELVSAYKPNLEDAIKLNLTIEGVPEAQSGQTIVYTITVKHALGSNNLPISKTKISTTLNNQIFLVNGDKNSNGILEFSETWVYQSRYSISFISPNPLVIAVTFIGENRKGNTVSATGTFVTSVNYLVYMPILMKSQKMPTPTPTAFCSSDSLIVEDFSNSDSGWLVGSFGETIYNYQDGEYSISSIERGGVRSASPYSISTDYKIQVSGRWQEKMGGEMGLIFGVTGNETQRVLAADTIYRFVVDTANQRFRIRFFDLSADTKNWQDVIGWTPNLVIKSGNQLNTLTFTCNNKGGKAYINDIIVWEDSLPISCIGNIGLTFTPSLGKDTEPESVREIRFDNVKFCGMSKN